MDAEPPKARSRADLSPGLYIVATPLGNLRDITLRALDVLAAADLVLCEDSRVSKKLLTRYGLQPRLLTYHEHNGAKLRPRILAALAEDKIVALISDAGTPLISDPGMPLVRAARADGHEVIAVPGPSAPIAALSAAGLPTDRFCFAGFLPPRKAARQKALEDLLAAPLGTLVLFESPRRLTDLLADLAELCPQAEICVARELTKKFEEIKTGDARALLAHFEAAPPRGELTVLIAPPRQTEMLDDAAIDALLRDAMAAMSRRDAVQNITELTGLKRKQIYARALALASKDPLAPSAKETTQETVKENEGQEKIGRAQKTPKNQKP